MIELLIVSLLSMAPAETEPSVKAGASPHGVTLAPAAAGGATAVLRNGRLWGRLLDNTANRDRQGSGFNPLVHLSYPGHPIFRVEDTGLNFEHIFNGAAADHAISMFTPRTDPVELLVRSESSAKLHWPGESNTWGIESWMTYDFVAPDAIDMTFRTRLTKAGRAPLGYVAYMWASYMAFARDRRIHFYGTDGEKEGWTSFGEALPNGGGIEMGTVAHAKVSPLPHEPEAQLLNVVENTRKRFLRPYYYGLIDGDHDVTTTDDTLACIMMFDQEEPIRFAMWNFISDATGVPSTHHPAWDWQYVVRDPELNRDYGYRARLTIRPWTNREEVHRLFESWRRGLR